MSKGPRRQRAVVVGAGITGVIAARVLADRFDHVLLIERDPHVTPRPHVHQLAHTHILGAHGYRLLCRLFPGFDEDLGAAGAPKFDFGECPFFAGRWAPSGVFGLVSRSFTRPLIETVLRRRLVTYKNVELVTGKRVRDFTFADGRITGVRFDDGSETEADLVVDAAGVGSKTPEWLAEHDYPVPTRSKVDLHGGALTQLFKPAPSRAREWAFLTVRGSPGNYRCGAISWVEEGLWRVSVWGFAGMRPSKDPAAFPAFARALTTPVFAELMEGAELVSKPFFYSNAWSQWIHYDRVPRFPDGLVVIGDATFHPNYEHGQGMTFCAMAAELVGEHVDRHALGTRRDSSLHFQQQLGALVAPWWDWNLAMELKVPGADAEPVSAGAALRHSYYRLIKQAAGYDPVLWKYVLEANQAVRSPRSLLTRPILMRALRHRLTDAAPPEIASADPTPSS